MIRKSPEMTSNVTARPGRGTPPCERTALTSASPPAQIAVPQTVDWLALGMMATTLLMVRGFTVNAAVAGISDAVSWTVSVIGVSAETSFGTMVNPFPVKDRIDGTMA